MINQITMMKKYVIKKSLHSDRICSEINTIVRRERPGTSKLIKSLRTESYLGWNVVGVS